jgi:ribosomal protein S18 acetylase RimI-like enzyme
MKTDTFNSGVSVFIQYPLVGVSCILARCGTCGSGNECGKNKAVTYRVTLTRQGQKTNVKKFIFLWYIIIGNSQSDTANLLGGRQQMIIRKATVDDIESINKLFYELDTGAIEMQPEHFKRGSRSFEYLSGLIEDEKSDFLLAVVDNDIIGFSLLFSKETADISLLVPCKYAYIQDFVVAEKYRNKGIGSVLMEESKRWAKERRMDYLRLSVIPANKDAQRFYARHGLTEQMITMEYSLHGGKNVRE